MINRYWLTFLVIIVVTVTACLASCGSMRYRQHPGVSTTYNDHGALLTTGQVQYELNDVGAFIWRQLETPKTDQELLGAILAEYQVDRVTARNDLDELIKELQRENLIVVEAPHNYSSE